MCVLQAQIDALRGWCESMQEEQEALREWLESSCVLQRESFLALVHRRRFSKVLARHPCSPSGAAAADALRTPELLQLLAGRAGPRAAASLAGACGALSRAMALKAPSGRLYAVGGSDSRAGRATGRVVSLVERFDEHVGAWEQLAPLPTPRSHLAVCACAGRVFALGGTDGTQVLAAAEAFDPDSGAWAPMPPMPTPRSGLAAAACGGLVYALGGREGFRSLGTAERLRVDEGRWEPLPPMQCRRRFLAAAALRGRLYAVGGEDDSFVALGVAERFVTAVERWESLPSMPTRRRGLAALTLNGRLFAIGGGTVHRSQLPQALDVIETYDAQADSWSTVSRLSSPRMFLVACALSGRMYTLGGSDGTQSHRTFERVLDGGDGQAGGVWVHMPPLPTRRVFYAGVASSA